MMVKIGLLAGLWRQAEAGSMQINS